MISIFRILTLALLVAPATLAAQANPLGNLFSGQEQAPAQDSAAPAQPDSAVSRFPGSYEVVSRSLAVADSVTDVEQRIARLADLSPLNVELADARERFAELRQQLSEVRSEAYPRPEMISRVHDQAFAHSERLDATTDRLSERLDQLAEIRTRWSERRAFWLEWSDSLRSDPEFAVLEPEIRGTVGRIDEVLDLMSAEVPTALALQRELDRLQQANLQIVEQTSQIRSERRAALLVRNRPALFSPGFWEALRNPAEATAPAPRPVEADFLRRHLGLLLVQLLLLLSVAWSVRRLRFSARPDEGWIRVLRHPLAVGAFVAVALLGPQYGPTPALWELGVWTVLAACTAILATGMFSNPRKRQLVYLLAGFYPAYLLLEVLPLPIPVFRLLLTAAAAAGAAFCVAFARRNHAAGGAPGFTWILRVATVAWGVVLGAEVLGFDNLARWIVESSISSAFAAFGVAFLVLLARGALHTVLRREPKGRFRFVRRVAYALAERLVWLLQAVLVVGAALYILTVWELIPSPLQTWNAVVGWGFTIGNLEITVGRVLLAALVLYVAFLISWMLRAFLQGEVFERWELGAGVGDSILKLLHYSLVVLGLLFALGAIGFELQNFALILGALGVGIGFGLQNVVNNFVSGLILLFERPVRVGDMVVIGGEWGTIEKIGLRSTVVLTLDQAEMIVPNGDLISEKVTNWTLSNPITRVVLPVGVAYGSDLETVFRELRAAADETDDVLELPPPQALFLGFGDSSLDFELRVWVRKVVDRPVVRSTLLTAIDRRFRAAGVEIPFPQRDLHVRSVQTELLEAARVSPAAGEGTGATR